MMPGLVVLLVAIVVAALAPFGLCEENSLVFSVEKRQPEKCCMPKKWSSSFVALDTINTAAPNVLAVQMDLDRGKQVFMNFTGSTLQNKILIDYKMGILYDVLYDSHHCCIRTPVSLPLIRCIPDDAEYLRSGYLGSQEKGSLPYNVWRINDTISGQYTILTMSERGCVPIVESITQFRAPHLNQLFMFAGFQPRLTHPWRFRLPKCCFQSASSTPPPLSPSSHTPVFSAP